MPDLRTAIAELRKKLRRAERLRNVLKGKGPDADYIGELVELRQEIGSIIIDTPGLLDAAERGLWAEEEMVDAQ